MTTSPKQEAASFYAMNYAYSELLFSENSNRLYLGSKSDRTCRFCRMGESSTTFGHDAHAIPECLGNKSIFSYYECDACNHFFGNGIENDFGNWTKPSRTLARVQGKRGVPSIKKSGSGQGQGWRIDGGANGLHFKDYESKPHFEIDEERKQLKFELTRNVYTPVAVLKAFVKIGLTLLPPEELPNFRDALPWIRDPDHTKPFVKESPVFHTFQPGSVPKNLGVAILIRRNHSTDNFPYAFLILGFGNDIYQVFLPCPIRDHDIYGKNLTIPPFPISGGPDPEKYGDAQIKTIDLCGKYPIRGETCPKTIRFDHMKI